MMEMKRIFKNMQDILEREKKRSREQEEGQLHKDSEVIFCNVLTISSQCVHNVFAILTVCLQFLNNFFTGLHTVNENYKQSLLLE